MPVGYFIAVPVEGFKFGTKITQGKSIIQSVECLYFAVVNQDQKAVLICALRQLTEIPKLCLLGIHRHLSLQ